MQDEMHKEYVKKNDADQLLQKEVIRQRILNAQKRIEKAKKQLEDQHEKINQHNLEKTQIYQPIHLETDQSSSYTQEPKPKHESITENLPQDETIESENGSSILGRIFSGKFIIVSKYLWLAYVFLFGVCYGVCKWANPSIYLSVVLVVGIFFAITVSVWFLFFIYRLFKHYHTL